MYRIEFIEEYKGLMHLVCKSYESEKDIIVCKIRANKAAFTMPIANVADITLFEGLPLLPKPTKTYETIRPNSSLTQRSRPNRGG